MNCYVYMIQGSDGYFYTGVTNDLEKRLDQHNGQIKGGARYTRKQRPYTLVWVEEHLTRSAALKREYAIKQLSRTQKTQLVAAGAELIPKGRLSG